MDTIKQLYEYNKTYLQLVLFAKGITVLVHSFDGLCHCISLRIFRILYFIRGTVLKQQIGQVSLGLLVCLILYIIAFFAFHTYKGVIRYSSFVDLHRVAYSTIAAGIGVCILHQIQVHTGITPYIVIPRFESAILIFIVATMLMWGLRIIVKSLHDTYRGNDSIQKD